MPVDLRREERADEGSRELVVVAGRLVGYGRASRRKYHSAEEPPRLDDGGLPVAQYHLMSRRGATVPDRERAHASHQSQPDQSTVSHQHEDYVAVRKPSRMHTWRRHGARPNCH